MRAYVAAETHNWNLCGRNPQVISDRLVPNSFVWRTARLAFLQLTIDIKQSIEMAIGDWNWIIKSNKESLRGGRPYIT